MVKINIISSNSAFAEDLDLHIKQKIPEAEIFLEYPVADTDMVFIDEDKNILEKLAEQYKELPIVFFSKTDETSEFADLIIKKPFRLPDFLQNLNNKTLLPKVRRKECLNFKEYSLYPVKKEIVSSLNKEIVKLTEKEVDIIKYLYQNTPDIATKEELLENVWGYSSDATTHTVETHIYRLRQKVEKEKGSQLIITENNGYRLNI